jgi:hypothetical protein
MFHVKQDAPKRLNCFSQNNPMQSSARLEIIVFHVKQLGAVSARFAQKAKEWNKQ